MANLKTSQEWNSLDTSGKIILYADGWDKANYQFSYYEEKITQVEYAIRKMNSTCIFKTIKTENMKTVPIPSKLKESMENTEETSLEVLTVEDMKQLPLTTQKLINELSAELNIKALSEFNPIVKSMVDMEKMKELKYIPEDKENAQAFTTNKVALGKFNASVGRTAKNMKAPLLATGKKITALEKAFKARGILVKDYLLKEFDPLIVIQDAEKAAKTAKKNKASIDKIADLSEEAIEQALVISRMKLKQKLDKELNSYVSDAVSKAKTFSKTALSKEIEELRELKDSGFKLEESEKTTLLLEQQEEIISMFTANIDSAIFILQTELDKPEILTSTHVSGISVPPIPKNIHVVDQEILHSPVSSMMAPSLTQTNPEFFKDAIIDILTDCMDSIKDLNPANEKEINVKKGLITGLEKMELGVIDYLFDGKKN